MTLDQAKKGSEVEVIAILDNATRSQLMRMGIVEGSRVVCQSRLPMGPIVVRCRRQEIAVGRKLAQRIIVK